MAVWPVSRAHDTAAMDYPVAMIERLGPYQVQRELGRGGMGVVYLATDTRLDRQVAIKALPAELASDPARLERFEREAKTLASLNHPNLAGIHGVEEQDGAKYLVLEFVEGETLADVLDRGPLPVDEAIEYAVQIAAGVEAAHEAGVIHRDLKPANIIVTSDGQAKVLDFGLARTDESGQSSTGALDSPTMTTPQPQHSPTIAGAILGTAAYMSPEQARGRRVDKRTDIWSFGVVLYELLVGSSPFHGETATDSIGAVLHKGLDLDQLPVGTPASVRRVLERCLVRDRNERYRDIGDVRLELLRPDSTDAMRSDAPARMQNVLMFGAVVLAALVAGAAAWFLKPSRPDESRQTVHAMVPLPKGIEPHTWPHPDLSDDGRRLVMKVLLNDELMIAVRDFGEPAMRVIPGTEYASLPALSPDGEWLLYRTKNTAYKRLIAGGPAIEICEVDAMRGGVWETDDSIILAPSNLGPLHRVSAAGGEPEPLYEIDGSQPVSDRHPSLLPNGRGVLFHRCRGDSADWEDSRLMLLSLEGGEPRELLRGVAHGRYLDSGHLVYQRQDSLFAAGFDLETLEFTTPETVVLEGINTTRASAPATFDLSVDGTLVYFAGNELERRRRIVEVDFDGVVTPLSSHIDEFEEIVPSDDGRFIATEASRQDGSDQIRIIELARDIVSPVAQQNAGGDYAPVWNPDGRSIAFTSDRDEVPDSRQVYRTRVGSASPAELLLMTEVWVEANDWSADGSLLVMEYHSDDRARDIGVIRFDDSGEIVSEGIEPLIEWPGHQWSGRLSPDDRWLLFHSYSEQAGVRIFVASMADPSISVQVSVGDANHAAWSPDGSTVYYASDAVRPITVFAADFNGQAADAPTVSSPRRVVDLATVDDLDSFYMNPDGTAFVVGESVDPPGDRHERAPRIVLNWSAWLSRKLPIPERQ